MFIKILIFFVLFHTLSTRIIVTGSGNRGRKTRRRNMIVNMRPIFDNEPIFGRVDVSKDTDPIPMPTQDENNVENPFSLEELAHKIGEYLCEKCDKERPARRRVHQKQRRARSNTQDERKQSSSIKTRKDTLLDLENRIINPIYTGEETYERHRRIKRNLTKQHLY